MTEATPVPSDGTAPRSCGALFGAFTGLALQGFGGVLAVAQRVICDERRWMSRREFVEMLAFAQVLPGPNVCNIALMVGDRFFGWRGAAAALAGMMAVPLVIVLVLTVFYVGYAQHPMLAGALKGMGAVAAGLILGTSLKLAQGLKGNLLGRAGGVLAALLTFVGIALARWPLVWVLAGVGGPACVYAAWRIRRAGGAAQ